MQENTECMQGTQLIHWTQDRTL